jgi:hypothetical protein
MRAGGEEVEMEIPDCLAVWSRANEPPLSIVRGFPN